LADILPNKLKALKLSSTPCGPATKAREACRWLSAAGPTNVFAWCPVSAPSHPRSQRGFTPCCWLTASAEPGKVLLFAVCILRSLLRATALSSVQIQHAQPDPDGTGVKSNTRPVTGCVNIQVSPPAAKRFSVLPLAPRLARSSLPSAPLCCLDLTPSSFSRNLQG